MRLSKPAKMVRKNPKSASRIGLFFVIAHIQAQTSTMKKFFKEVSSNIYDLLGEEAIKGRPLLFKVFVGTIVLGVTFFVLFNLIQLVF